jgi:hypothetical protein
MLYAQELPYFEDRGMCGNCGLTGDLSEVDWFDFLSYIQYKAILRQFPPPKAEGLDRDETAAATTIQNSTTTSTTSATFGESTLASLKLVSGELLLDYVLREASPSDAAVLAIRSSDLRLIRQGVRTLLRFFEDKGAAAYMCRCCLQCSFFERGLIFMIGRIHYYS